MNYRILAIDPGSTSTKIAVFEDENEQFRENISHSREELDANPEMEQQFRMRLSLIEEILRKHGLSAADFSCVVGRGGHLPGIVGGGYYVNDAMKRRLILGPVQPHASNLGALLAAAVAKASNAPALIYDAVSSDELKPIAKITGMPDVERHSLSHVLNTKAVARKVAAMNGTRYEDVNYLIVHLGGGISVSAHEHGKMTDVITDDAGPFSPERSGSIPLTYIIDMCYSGLYSKKDLLKKMRGQGGLSAYLGTNDCREIERRIEDGDEYAKLIYEAEAYQVAKGIGELSTTFEEQPIDAIIMTGGLAHSEMLTGMIRKRVSFIAPIIMMPGENELEALSMGALRILRGEETGKEYVDPDSQKTSELFV